MPDAKPERTGAWARPGFRQLTRGWVVINIADAALFLMVAAWVKDMTGSDAAAAGVLVVIGLPALVAPFLGQIVDRHSRKRVLVVTAVLMVPVLMALGLVDGIPKLWLVYLVMFIYGCSGHLVAAAQSGLVRDLLPDEELASGNGVLSTIDMALRLVSPLLGTGLYVVAGPMAVVGLTMLGFALGAYLIDKIQVEESDLSGNADGAYWQELTAGFRHLWNVPVLRRLTVILAIALGAIGLANAAVFPAMEQGFGVEAAMLGVFVSLQGIGSVVGGATSARLIARLGEPRTVGIGMASIGIGLFPLAGSNLPLGIVGLVLIGLGVPWVIVAFTTVRQRLTPPTLQGRTAAATSMAVSIPQSGATAVGAAMLGLVDYRLLVLATVLIVLVSALSLRSARPEVGTSPPLQQ